MPANAAIGCIAGAVLAAHAEHHHRLSPIQIRRIAGNLIEFHQGQGNPGIVVIIAVAAIVGAGVVTRFAVGRAPVLAVHLVGHRFGLGKICGWIDLGRSDKGTEMNPLCPGISGEALGQRLGIQSARQAKVGSNLACGFLPPLLQGYARNCKGPVGTQSSQHESGNNNQE